MADKRILVSEEMVGALHDSKDDTLNRLALISLTVEGDIKSSASVGSSGATLARILSGDLSISLSPNSYSSSASTVTAASAGTFVQTLTITLATSAGAPHYWADGLIFTATVSKATNDADCGVPTVSTSKPPLSGGQVVMTLTYDTDAGATKVYTTGDTVYCTIVAPTILGYSVNTATLINSLA